MDGTTEDAAQGAPKDKLDNRADSTQPQDYQDKFESHESRLKAIWDKEMGGAKKTPVFYRNAAVLLLSWDPKVDDLHTDKEVTELETLFDKVFHYKIVRKVLYQDPGPSAQAQVNKHLSNFVYKHDDSNSLLIVYYAGHGRAGDPNGSLSLAANNSLLKENNQLHEIVWDSAEHNIRATKSDVLVIFDCCHAGALEKNIRSPFNRRAFEYLAATSAKSTTRKPGPKSFTTALIWALKDLVAKGKSFTTQELLTRILHAPEFPDDQGPRLSERGAACLRRIALAPLNLDDAPETYETQPQDEEEGERVDLSLRFLFNKYITEEMVTELAMELRKVISESSFKATTILWDGINSESPSNFKRASAYYFANKWLKNHRSKNNASPIDSVPHLGLSGPGSIEGNSRIDTPIPNRENAEPLIGEDDGTVAEPTSCDAPSKKTNRQGTKRKMESVGMESPINFSSASSSTPLKRSKRAIGVTGR